ncbi:MAG: hypothetical protein ACRBFS_14205 [Aureispira sp.]
MLYKNEKPAIFRITPYYENPTLMKLVQQSSKELSLNYPDLPPLDFVPLPPLPPKDSGDNNHNNITFDL